MSTIAQLWLPQLLLVVVSANPDGGSPGTLPVTEDMPGFHLSAGNPFFDQGGRPFFDPPPPTLLDDMRAAGCSWAWRRRQHVWSELDEQCYQLVRPFLSTSGGVLGTYVAIQQADPPVFLDTSLYPLMASLQLQQRTNSGDVEVDLSRMGYDGPHTHFYDSRPNHTLSELDSLEHLSPAAEPGAYLIHGFGNFSWGVATMACKDRLLALKYSTELWLYLGHHCKQGDELLPFLQNKELCTLIIHGAHAALWTYVDAPPGRALIPGTDRASAAAFWDLTESMCNESTVEDFSVMFSCSHGIGHALAYFVTSGRATLSDVQTMCNYKLPDGRLVSTCVTGLFHEFLRGGLWRIPELHMAFNPAGVADWCDVRPNYDALTPPSARLNFFNLCFGWTLHAAYGNTASVYSEKNGWFQQTSDAAESERPILQLTTAGHAEIVALYSNCARLELELEAAWCLTYMLEWFGLAGVASSGLVSFDDIMIQFSNGFEAYPPSELDWDVTFMTADNFAKVGPVPAIADPRVPRLTAKRNQGGQQVVDDEDYFSAFCEAGASTYFVWMVCAQGQSTEGSTPTGPLVQSGQWPVPGAYYKRDMWAISEPTAYLEISWQEMCEQRFASSKFAQGTELEVAFARDFCVLMSYSHSGVWTLLFNFNELKKVYAAYVESGGAIIPALAATSLLDGAMPHPNQTIPLRHKAFSSSSAAKSHSHRRLKERSAALQP